MLPEMSERVILFRRECRNYMSYEAGIDRIDNDLEVLEMRMANLHSINFEKIGSRPSPSERPIIELIEKKTRMLEQKQYYKDRIGWVNECMENIPSPAYRTVIWKTYVQKESLQKFADRYNMNPDYIYKLRRMYMEQALTDEIMIKYYKIIDDFLGSDEERASGDEEKNEGLQ